jgi:hypothetical protein
VFPSFYLAPFHTTAFSMSACPSVICSNPRIADRIFMKFDMVVGTASVV